ncbi:MAG: hypothetical protein FWG96_04440 [Methanomassiliicoccaceae archaeon]|nr:hypothetical protein [Methanomassiliicoccaceae archaeon]
MVGTAVLMTGLGYDGGGYAEGLGVFFGAGAWENLTFAIMFVLAIIWSIFAKTPKNLSLILVTTTLIFLFVGLSGLIDGDYWHWLIGIAALLNFLLNVYLAFALALDGKLPIF